MDSQDERLRAVERALTESDRTLDSIPDAAALTDEVDDLDSRLAALETHVEELDAALQAVRGYVGNIRHVNREVERTAEAALAKAQSLDETDALELETVAPETPDNDTDEKQPTAEHATETGVLDRVRGLL